MKQSDDTVWIVDPNKSVHVVQRKHAVLTNLVQLYFTEFMWNENVHMSILIFRIFQTTTTWFTGSPHYEKCPGSSQPLPDCDRKWK